MGMQRGRSILRPIAVSWIFAASVLIGGYYSSRSTTATAFHGPVLSFRMPGFLEEMFRPPVRNEGGRNGVEEIKRQLLSSISSTSNGKTATPSVQRSVLSLVRSLETSDPPPQNLFTDPRQIRLLEGVWFLKYTSPSSVPDADSDSDSDSDTDTEEGGDDTDSDWSPSVPEDSRIETRQIESKGSVSAAGITVDVSDKDTLQILGFGGEGEEDGGPTLRNEVDLGWGKVVVGGGLRPSDKVYNRAVASFTVCKITLSDGGPTLDLSFLFSILSAVRGTAEAGWLETTFVDEDVRIGRGNKGTLFVLTREKDAVS